MAEIELQSLRKTFGPVEAVADVSLVIRDGTFTVLLGPSGCGKTTTLNMIAGLEEVTDGLILFDGDEVQDLPPHKRDIAMVFQSYALYPNRTVRDNIAFPLRMQRVAKQDIENRVTTVASSLGIAGLLGRYPRQLSGGQQQRVALARAIVRRPRAFLLDEPLSNLDAKLRADMRFELKSLQRELGGTFVHVTHDQAEAMSLADSMVVMDQGRIQQVGHPSSVYRRPVNLFVAGFVGIPTMNIITGQVADGSFSADGWSTPLAAPVAGGPAILGVRSEDVLLESATDGGNGKVTLVEQVGSDALVEIEAGFGRIVARVPADTDLGPGAAVALRVNSQHLHVFDPETGTRRSTVSEPATTSA